MGRVSDAIDDIIITVGTALMREEFAETVKRWQFELKIYIKSSIYIVLPLKFGLIEQDHGLSFMEKWIAGGRRLKDYGGSDYFNKYMKEEPFKGKNLAVAVNSLNAETLAVLRETRAKIPWVQAAMWGRNNKQVGLKLQFRNVIVIDDDTGTGAFAGIKAFEMQYEGASTLESSWPSIPDGFATGVQDKIRAMKRAVLDGA